MTHGNSGAARFVVNAAAVTSLSKKWYLALARGLVALCTGLLALALPTSAAMVLIAAYLLLDGAIAIAFGVEIRSSRWTRAALVLEGLTGILAAIFVMLHASSQTYLVFIIGMWAVLSGLLEIFASTTLPNASWPIATLGFVSLSFGAALFAWPLLAMLTFLYLLTSYIGLAAIVFIVAALILRRVFFSSVTGRSSTPVSPV